MKPIPFLLLAFLVAGCFHDPSPTGVSLLPNGDLANVAVYDSRTDSAGITATTSKVTRITAASAPLLSIGTAEGYSASAMIRWLGLPTDIGQGGRIISATVTLHPSLYRIGNAGEPISIDVRAIGRAWSSYTATYDSLDAIRASSTPAGSFQGALADSIAFTIDSSVVRRWLQHEEAGEYTQVYGLLLQPGPGSNTVQSFHSLDPLSDGTANPRSPSFVVRMEWNGKDTTITATLGEDTYVADYDRTPDPSALTLYGGIARRGHIVPNFRAIPAGSIVNDVKLTLRSDSANTVIKYRGIDSVFVYVLNADGTLGSTYGVARRTSASGEYTVNASFFVSVVQRWVNSPQLETAFVLVKAGENADLDRTTFYGASAPLELRPRFIITYTRQQ